MPKVIAFGRRKQVGKDTAARFLKSYLCTRFKGLDIKIVGFADKIKEQTYELYSWAGLMPGYWYEEGEPGQKLKDVILPKLGKSPRKIWIDYGNGIRDCVYEPTWAHYILYNIRADVIIIKDLRFPTEAEMIREGGGYPIEIDNPRVPDEDDGADEPLRHYQGWFDRVLNDSTYDVFHKRVIQLAEKIWLP